MTCLRLGRVAAKSENRNFMPHRKPLLLLNVRVGRMRNSIRVSYTYSHSKDPTLSRFIGLPVHNGDSTTLCECYTFSLVIRCGWKSNNYRPQEVHQGSPNPL